MYSFLTSALKSRLETVCKNVAWEGTPGRVYVTIMLQCQLWVVMWYQDLSLDFGSTLISPCLVSQTAGQEPVATGRPTMASKAEVQLVAINHAGPADDQSTRLALYISRTHSKRTEHNTEHANSFANTSPASCSARLVACAPASHYAVPQISVGSWSATLCATNRFPVYQTIYRCHRWRRPFFFWSWPTQ